MTRRLCVRWTIGDLLPYGIEALRLSVWGAFRCFGDGARYVIGVHDVAPARAQALVRGLPDAVAWQRVDPSQLPSWLRRADVSPRFALRFAPVLLDREDRERAELRLDRGCVLFATPPTVAAWLDDPNPRACALLADHGGEPNTTLRGAGRGFDLEEALRETLREAPRALRSREDAERLELDALSLLEPPRLVPPREVDVTELGSHGVRLAPPLDGSAPSAPRDRARWEHTLAELHARLGVPRPARSQPSLAS